MVICFVLSFCLSVFLSFCLYTFLSIYLKKLQDTTSIELKLSGQILHGAHTDSSKFREIRLKNKVRKQFSLFFDWAYAEKSASLRHIRKSISRLDFFFTNFHPIKFLVLVTSVKSTTSITSLHIWA